MEKNKVLVEPNPEWTPRYWTKPLTDYTSGDDVIDFAETLLTISKGKKQYQGKKVRLAEWQKWLLRAIDELDEEGNKRYRIIIIGLPRKNGKTMLMSLKVLHELVFGINGGEIYSAATDRETAKLVWEEVEYQVKTNPVLTEVIKLQRDKITVPEKNVTYKALSSDASKNQGYNPSLTIFDELHAVGGINGRSTRGDAMWAAMTEGSAARENPQLIAITTAGGNKDTLLGKFYEYGVKVAKGEIEDKTFGFYWWSADETDDPTDYKTWLKANPNLAEGLMDKKDFEAGILRANATSYNSFLRYKLNMWVRLGVENFIAPHYWEEAKREKSIELGEEIYMGFDGSINDDATGLVAINNDGTLKVLGVWETNRQADPDYLIPRDEVRATIEKAFQDYKVIKLWADPTHFEDMLKELADKYKGKVERIPQSNSRVIPMAQQFIADVIYKNIGHTNEEPLTRHVLNAVATEGGSYKKEKPKSPNKIDLLACAVMANGARHANKRKSNTKRRNIIL